MNPKILERYEPIIGRLSRLYHGLYIRRNQDFDIDVEDFEQAGRMAVFNLSKNKPEKIDCEPYVAVVIKHAIYGEMRKMKHKVKQVYLASGFEGQVHTIDVLPTREKGNKTDELEEIFYRIKHEFSDRDAEGLERLLDKCENIYGLHLTEPPSTDTKDRVKVVTKMDLNDEEMQVYAEVLLGVRGKFPDGWIGTKNGILDKLEPEAKDRLKKYLNALLSTLDLTPREFAQSNDTIEQIQKYKLYSFYIHNSQNKLDFIRVVDPSIVEEEVFHLQGKWRGRINNEKIAGLIRKLVKEKGGIPYVKATSFKEFPYMNSLLHNVFNGNPRLAIEFAYPKTYPELSDIAEDIRVLYNTPDIQPVQLGNIQELISSNKEKQLKTIISSYKSTGGNASETARRLHIGNQKIRKCWKNAGFEIKGPGERNALSQEEQEQIVDSYYKFKGVPFRASKALGYAFQTVEKYWRRAGLTNKVKEDIG